LNREAGCIGSVVAGSGICIEAFVRTVKLAANIWVRARKQSFATPKTNSVVQPNVS
jgi:hypothetical protein